MSIPVAKPSIKRRDMNSVLTCLVSDSLGPGSLSRKLASEICAYLGLQAGIALREYGRAIELVFDVLDLREGSRIIISPLAPLVYYEIAKRRGVECLFPDVDVKTGCISLESAAEMASAGAAACILHTTLGFVPEYESIAESGIPIIEDISEGIGAHNGEIKCGTFGTITIIAMEVDHVITSGGGVIIASGSRKESSLLKRYSREFPAQRLLPDMNAALGLTQIQDIERYIQKRREIAGIYVKAVMSSRHGMLSQTGDAENVYYSFPVIVESGMADCIQYAKKNGAESRPAFENSILAHYGTEIFSEGRIDKQLPKAYSLLNRCLLFPCYPSLSSKDVSLIQKILTTLP